MCFIYLHFAPVIDVPALLPAPSPGDPQIAGEWLCCSRRVLACHNCKCIRNHGGVMRSNCFRARTVAAAGRLAVTLSAYALSDPVIVKPF